MIPRRRWLGRGCTQEGDVDGTNGGPGVQNRHLGNLVYFGARVCKEKTCPAICMICRRLKDSEHTLTRLHDLVTLVAKVKSKII